MKIKVGDHVKFAKHVKARVKCSRTNDMRGVVIAVREPNIAIVDCGATWQDDEGRQERWIPVANLQVIR